MVIKLLIRQEISRINSRCGSREVTSRPEGDSIEIIRVVRVVGDSDLREIVLVETLIASACLGRRRPEEDSV
jgi:hypothetical protein